MKLKFSIGPGNTLVTSRGANVISKTNYVSLNNFVYDFFENSQYLKSNFFYLSSSENGIAPRTQVGAPEKIVNADIQKVLDENLRSVIGLFNFRDVKKGEEMVATAAAEGVSNADQ